MKLTTLLASSAALAAIAIAVPATIAPSWSPVATAQAATSISFSLFYDGLDDHGDWVSHDGDYVFVPAIDDRDWQPYTEGHWVYARGYGWTWVSDEPFGWATYHYGRWGFDDEIGWYWVPGTRWAPAWVSWRRSGNHVAWAPLPPHHGHDDDISITVNIGSIPDYYWVAVPSRSFLEVNLNVVIIDDDRERRRIVNDSEFVGSVQIENNIIVNNVININYVEENTGKKVTEVEVKQTDDPAKAKSSDGQVEVFNGTVEPDKSAKPPKLKEVTEDMDHIKQIAGAAHIGIGGDYDGITETVLGLEDVSKYPDLFVELVHRGWTDAELRGLANENVLRALSRAEVVSARLRKERPASTKTIEQLDGKRMQ